MLTFPVRPGLALLLLSALPALAEEGRPVAGVNDDCLHTVAAPNPHFVLPDDLRRRYRSQRLEDFLHGVAQWAQRERRIYDFDVGYLALRTPGGVEIVTMNSNIRHAGLIGPLLALNPSAVLCDGDTFNVEVQWNAAFTRLARVSVRFAFNGLVNAELLQGEISDRELREEILAALLRAVGPSVDGATRIVVQASRR